MLHPSTKRLIDKLSEMTRKQRVAWTEGENGAVIHDTEGYRVVLTPEPHAVLLTDGLGREIETCMPEEIADELDSQGRPYGKFIGELYREAQRHARGTEKAIRTLLAGLDATEAETVPVPAEPAIIPVVAVDAPDATTDETAPIESESETDISHAVATMADKINGAPPAPAAEAPPAEVQAETPAPEPEAPATEPVAETMAAEPESEPQPEPQPEPAPVIMETAPEPEPEPEIAEPAAAPEPVEEEWIVRSAASEPLPEPEEEPGSFGTFAAFEPAVPEPVAEPVAPAPVEAAEPEPEPAAPAPTLSQPISLSSIPMGFGLGAAQRVPTPPTPRPQPEPEAAQAEPPRRIIIDGTLDLPASPLDAYPDAAETDHYPPPTPETRPGDVPGEEKSPTPDPGSTRRFNPWN